MYKRQNNTNAANGIAFGSSRDTNLYRVAANRLRTDDDLSVGGSIGISLPSGPSTTIHAKQTNAQLRLEHSTNDYSVAVLQNTGWDQGLALVANGSYNGSGDPTSNIDFLVNNTGNSTGAGLLFFDGNGAQEWEFYSSGVSTGTGTAASLTKLAELSQGEIFLSPQGNSTDFHICLLYTSPSPRDA